MTARACRWEIAGSYGAYWVRMVAANGANIIGNPQQRYHNRQDALHSIELVYGRAVARATDGQLSIAAGHHGYLEVRDCTTRRPRKPKPTAEVPERRGLVAQ